MKRIVHPLAGAIALATISSFWCATLLSELFGSHAIVTAVKTAVPWGFLLLIPALAATGGSGLALSKGQRQGLVGAKLKRMPFIAANGLLVLIPSALFLAAKARAGAFDSGFYTVQVIELTAGAVNITLLTLGMRDGMRLSGWRASSRFRPASTSPSNVQGQHAAARDTFCFTLARPQGFAFRPGQAVYVVLPGKIPADGKGRVRTFSIASAPQESGLTIATRMGGSAFKHALAALPPGAPLQIEGPYGDLVLEEGSDRPIIFLAGGIGITPFRSMIADACARTASQPMYLFYSNRRVEDAAFLDELQVLAAAQPNFHLIATLTDEAAVALNWAGERGRITHAMIVRHVPDIDAAVYYVAGPPKMVAAMEDLLRQAGVPAKDIHAEAFNGY